MKTKTLTRLAALAALSVVLVLLIRFPLFPAAPYLEYDPGDIPILITSFMYGPWCGLAVTAVVSLIQGLTVSSAGGWIGILMHILATGAFGVSAGCIYKADKSKKHAILALVVGSLTMAAVMCACNYFLTPIYTGMPRGEVAKLLLPVIAPFNLLKAGINSVITMLVYKSLGRLLRR